MKEQISQQRICCGKAEEGGPSSGRGQRNTSWRKVAFELNLGNSARHLKVEMAVLQEQRHGVYVTHCGWRVDVFEVRLSSEAPGWP